MDIAGPSSIVSLSISCRELADLDFASKSDPLVYVLTRNNANADWEPVGHTEMIKDTLNPDFTEQVTIQYYFEMTQHLRFVVVDVDNKQDLENWKEQDLIAETETLLATIVASSGSQITIPLTHKNKKRGILTCKADEVLECKQALKLQFGCDKLDNKDGFFGKSDPYLVFSRARGDGTWIPVHRTEVVKNNCSPVFKTFQISLTKLCNSMVDTAIKIECSDWDSDGSSDFIGGCETTARELIEMTTINWGLVNPKKKKKSGLAGSLKLLVSELTTEFSFIDFIQGGCEVSLFSAIDFTASNGSPNDPASLHCLNDQNQYSKALWMVGSVLAPYDSDGLFPMSGFGAKINGQANHCFPMTPPEGVQGVEALVNAYHSFVPTATLWGPTNFAPTIQAAAALASQHQSQEQQKYFVLLILTDGVITDVDQTKMEIINASRLPLSIVIVGVGNADFSQMDALDSDDGLLTFRGKKASRDIVQFVPFRQFNDVHRLAQATLSEIPGQMLSFFKSRGFKPNPSPQ